MQLQEFAFVYADLKQQAKETPPLQQLLRLAEKSTRKLECFNLYSAADRRDFDLELEQQQIMKGIIDLYLRIVGIEAEAAEESIEEIRATLDSIKSRNIENFDLLSRQDELLTEEVEQAEYYLEQFTNDTEIKEEDEYDDEAMKDSNSGQSDPSAIRVGNLKKEIDMITAKIAKIANGRGKWFQSDHNDFVKIYNRCAGNTKRVIEEGVRVLGMKNTQVMDHIEIYESYLQLEKEKKIVTEEFKQIKLYEKLEQDEQQERRQAQQQQKSRQRKLREAQENQKKKELVQKFKQKKQEEKLKMQDEQQRKQRQKIVKVPLPPSKKKEIIERNQKYILQKQNNFKKIQQKVEEIHQKAAMSRGKVPSQAVKPKSLVKTNSVQKANSKKRLE